MIYTFDDFEVDEALFELRQGGLPVRIPPKVFDTILFLIRNRDRVVTKRELMAVVWNGATVTDDALNQAVRKARNVLGGKDCANSPIQTVRGRGYRFASASSKLHVAPLHRVAWDNHPPASARL